jgi:LysR family transcriptional regulator, glycine cleavage system transcriptional activator
VRLPSLKFLKTFHVAADRLSFKAAADELFITPSAVSHQIKALEEQLGIALFERGPHSLTLTEAGQSYLQHVETVFTRLETVTEQLRISHGRDVVRLHVPPFFATEMLLPKLRCFLEGQPDTDIHINTVVAPLQSHSADADLSIIVGAAPEVGFASHKLFSQSFVPAAAPALIRRVPVKTVADLNNHSLIIHEARRDSWEQWSKALGVMIRPKKLLRVDTMYAAAEAAEHGAGIALVSSRLANERFGKGTLTKIFDAELHTGESYYLISRDEDALRADVQAFTRWIVREFGAAA